MGVLVACKNEEDPIKNKGAREVTTLFIDFSHAQGQLTPKSVMESCLNSNPSKHSWLTLLPARMKKIHWKMKVLEHSLQSRPPSPKRAERKVRRRPFQEAGSGQNNGTR